MCCDGVVWVDGVDVDDDGETGGNGDGGVWAWRSVTVAARYGVVDGFGIVCFECDCDGIDLTEFEAHGHFLIDVCCCSSSCVGCVGCVGVVGVGSTVGDVDVSVFVFVV